MPDRDLHLPSRIAVMMLKSTYKVVLPALGACSWKNPPEHHAVQETISIKIHPGESILHTLLMKWLPPRCCCNCTRDLCAILELHGDGLVHLGTRHSESFG